MAQNDFLTFAAQPDANVLTQAEYAALPALPIGFQSGIAQSKQLNKVWRQASIMAAVIAQMIADKTGQDVIDDGTTATIKAHLIAAIDSMAAGQVQTAGSITCHASGTADAITGTFTPAITTLTDGQFLLVRAAAANATATPTFTPNAGTLAVKPIVKGSNVALVAGDIAGPAHWLELQYDATLDKWVLLNPAIGLAEGNFVKKSGDTMPGELINTAAGLGRASPFQAVTAGNAFRWDAPASEEFTCAVGLESENGRAFMTYFAYHGPAQNTFRRSSAQFLPGAWVYEPFSGTLSYLTAPAGTADADITDWT